MAKQTFTTGQVLTAAQMTSLQQTAMGGGSATAKTASYTLVAADAGTTVIMNSASATTITVNTSLFSAGDTVFIQNIGAGISTITAGTATVNTASSLALAQYESGNLYFTAAGTSIFSKADGAASAAAAFKGVRCTIASLSIANATDQVILSTTETFDEGAYHSNATNTGRLTVPVGQAGYYDIYFSMQWNNGATGTRSIEIQKNGTTNITRAVINPTATQYLTCNGSTTFYLAETDYVQFLGTQTSGTALNIDQGSFGMNKVG